MTTTTPRLFEVGGCVRDDLLGVATKDIDFAVEFPHLVGTGATAGFTALQGFLQANGFETFLESPEFLTIRARFPKAHQHARLTADFVLCRRDGFSTDGRRPDEVFVGTLADDLARRDFTVNAMARSEDGTLIDPHNGQEDLGRGLLRAVGDPMTRIREDSLRALRAVRFVVTKGFTFDEDLLSALRRAETARLLANVSTERRREELGKAFAADTLFTLRLLRNLGPNFERAALADLRLSPTMKEGRL